MKLIKLQCAYRLRVSQYELQFTLLVPLIAVKFSARIVVIHLTALLEYLHDCSIRVFNLDNPPTYNNHGSKKPPCNKVINPDQTSWPILSLIKTDPISHKQHTSKKPNFECNLVWLLECNGILARSNGPVWAVSIRKRNQK